MVLVTNDPAQYILWSVLFLGAIMGIAIAIAFGKWAIFNLRWALTKPPVRVSEGDYFTLRNGETAKVRYMVSDERIAVDELHGNGFSLSEVVELKDLRDF